MKGASRRLALLKPRNLLPVDLQRADICIKEVSAETGGKRTKRLTLVSPVTAVMYAPADRKAMWSVTPIATATLREKSIHPLMYSMSSAVPFTSAS